MFRALHISENVLGPEHIGTAEAINDLAGALSDLARYEQALPLQLRSLAIREKVLGPEHPGTALALNNLASTYSALAHHEKALPLQLRSLAIREKALGPEHPDTALAMSNLASTYLDSNQTELAAAMLKSAVNTYQVIRERVSQIGATELSSYTKSISGTYQRLASVLTDQGRLAEAQMVLDMLKEDEQFDFIRRSSSADPRRTRIGYTPTEERWMSRYREIADRLAALGREEQALQKQAKLGLTDEQKKRQAVLLADLKVAQTAFVSFLEQMRQEFAAKGPARAVEFTESSVKALAELQDLLKGLGDDVALLRIYLTDENVNFLLTTPGVQLARSVKIKTQDLSRQVAEFGRLLRDPKSDPLPAAQALYKLLLAPVEQDLQQAGAKTVMLSLDGVLRYLPFGVLHDGQRFALQRWNLPIYTSVVRERLRDATNANWQAVGLGVTRAHGSFKALPAVRTEMNSIIRTGASGVLPGEVHLDEAFTAQRLKAVSQRQFSVVHVASHFQFSPGTEVNSFLLLGDGSQLTLGDIRTQNYRFDDVDLLTLSACDTGLGGGRDQRGREIEGFGVIAQQQGAKAVLATLWQVADSSTATLMGDMYLRRTQSGLSKIEALRQAQVALASQPRTAHPFYWAPFILMGNWK
jgi:CHAT domain-containing protein